MKSTLSSTLSQVIPPTGAGPAPPPKHTKPATAAGVIPIRFSPKVEEALDALCPSGDPLDSPDFDVMEYVNAKLAGPEALLLIDDVATDLHGRLERTERDLTQSVRSDALSSRDTEKELQYAKESVLGLFSQVAEVKMKAEQSEIMVRTILSDIEQLDSAKRNLTSSMKTVTELKKMTTGLYNLQQAIDKKNYDDASSFVMMAKATMTGFEPYEKMGKIKELSSKLAVRCRQLENKLKLDLVIDVKPGKATQKLDPPSPRLRELCLVASALGPETVLKIQRQFILEQLEDYRQAFRQGTEDSQLVRTERRYAWLRRFLRFYQEYLRFIFPDDWYVPHELAVEFCTITREALDAQLQIEANTIEVSLLHRCVEKTMDFEKELTLRARTPWMTDVGDEDDNDNEEQTEEEQVRTAEAIRRKWTARVKAQRAGANDCHVGKEYLFVGTITPCFENHLIRYVQYVEEQMMTHVGQSVVDEDQWNPVDDASDPEALVGTHLTCANDVFTFIQESLKHVAVISKGATLVQMADVWQKGLRRLSELLMVRIPKDVKGKEDIRVVCLIMNTAQFCTATIPQLVDEVVAKLEESWQSKVCFDECLDAFTLVTTTAMTAFFGGLEKRMQPSFVELVQTNWGTFHAGDLLDESRYIGLIRRTLIEGVETAAKVLDPTLLRLTVMKLAKSFLSQYLGTLYKMKKINAEATHQLRVDVGALNKIFQTLPNAENPARFDAKSLTTYHKTVTREINRATAALQIVSMEAEPQMLDVYMELVQEDDRSCADFGRLLDLKGMQKPERMAMVEALRRRGVRESTERDSQGVALKVDEKDFADTVKQDLKEMKNKFDGVNINKMITGFFSTKDKGGQRKPEE
eukprot:PhF_6_TR26082/c0_g1_i1/m.36828/K20299/VPS53; vacuolar protein sorting-associated protein 53